MPELEELRSAAREIFEAALTRVDARAAVRSAIARQGSQVKVVDTVFELGEKGIYVVALGKAATSMAFGLSDALGDSIKRAIVSGPPAPAALFPPPTERFFAHDRPVPNRISLMEGAASPAATRKGWQFFAGGHPLPNEASLLAAWQAFELLEEANAREALVIFLISGGGSAMLEFPRYENTPLEDLREANRQLVGCGATISEINSVRRAFSAVKGGGLAARAPYAPQVSLIVSDTNEGCEADVASGPTLPTPTNSPGPKKIVTSYKLESLPPSILNAIEKYAEERRKEVKGHPSYVLLSNETALTAASDAAGLLGFAVQVSRDICEQSVVEGARLLIERLRAMAGGNSDKSGRVCLLSGGEFSCPVRGDGIGGRNSETVLRVALELEKRCLEAGSAHRLHWIILSTGTDGIDGNSPAAGAIADGKTLARARSLDLDPQVFLEKSDAFRFFTILGDTIMTGPTGTNVRDLRILLTSF